MTKRSKLTPRVLTDEEIDRMFADAARIAREVKESLRDVETIKPSTRMLVLR